MKSYFVPTLMSLLLAGVLHGQTPQNGATGQGGQQMPGMTVPEKEKAKPQQQPMPSVQMQQEFQSQQPKPDTGATYTLEQLRQLAMEHNPTLKMAQTEIRAAEGRKRQAGLYPNPTIGYLGEQIRGGSQGGGEQGGFIQQDIVLGGKLGAAKRVVEQDRRQAEVEREEQSLRVQNAVAIGYYQILAAQETVAIRERMLKLAQDAVATTQQLLNVGQADQPDLLQAQVEAGREEIALIAAQHRQQMQWTSLAAVVGQPKLPFGTVAGKLEEFPEADTQKWLESILQNSPAVKIAEVSVAHARAELDRTRRESIPNLQLRGGVQQNLERLETSGRSIGLQGFAEVGVQIPIFNRNQGNIEAAKANIDRADLERQRVQLLLQERSAAMFQNYLTSKAAVERYRKQMIPQAEQAYKLYLSRYNSMAAAYPQVLISQRTLFQLQTDYIASLESLWVNTVALKGFLLIDGLEAPTPPSEMDRPVRETNLPMGSGMIPR